MALACRVAAIPSLVFDSFAPQSSKTIAFPSSFAAIRCWIKFAACLATQRYSSPLSTVRSNFWSTAAATTDDGLVENEDGRGDHGCPQAALIAHRRLRDVRGAHDLIRDPVDFLLLIPRPVRIEFHIERGSEHFRRQFLGVITGSLFFLAE